MASLTGNKVNQTYKALIKTGNNNSVGTQSVQLTDGLGNPLPIEFSSSGVKFIGNVDLTSATVSGSGVSGTSGSSGSSGSSGVNGTSGTSGATGSSGQSGSSGTSGISGTSGSSGQSGSSGTSGISGSSGSSGQSGSSGTSGQSFIWRGSWSVFTNYSINDVVQYGSSIYISLVNGNISYQPDFSSGQWALMVSSGNSGSSGTSGISGSSGSSGVSGSSGTSGISGSSGSSGESGSSGTSGISGSSGSSGESGSSGTSGVSGTSGSAGTSGINGSSGTSGSSGLNGSSGTSGISPTQSSPLINGSGLYSLQSAPYLTLNPATAAGTFSIAIGDNTLAGYDNSIAFGKDIITSQNGIYIGNNVKDATAGSARGIMAGVNLTNLNSGQEFVIYGTDINNNNYDANVLIGFLQTANTQGVVHIGRGHQHSGLFSVNIGWSNNRNNTGTAHTAVGYDTQCAGEGAVALGHSAKAMNERAIAIGLQASATESNCISIGYSSLAGNLSSVSIGYDSRTIGEYAVAYGREADATKDNTIAVGHKAQAEGLQSITIGYESSTTATYSVVLGARSSATHDNSVVLGASMSSKFPDTTHLNKLAIYNVGTASDNTDAVSKGLTASQLYRTDTGALYIVY